MNEIWLIRHGETDWNRGRRMQGQLDVGLNDHGRRQAAQVAERLAALAAEHPVDAIYSSDLHRAHDTARPTAERLGLPVHAEAGLRERHYGVLQGLTRDEIATLMPDVSQSWLSRHPDAPLPSGESLRAFHDRVVATLSRIGLAHRGQRVLAFTHGGVLDVAYRHAMGLGFADERKHLLLNASINRIVVDSDSWRVLEWGEDSHLTQASDEISP